MVPRMEFALRAILSERRSFKFSHTTGNSNIHHNCVADTISSDETPAAVCLHTERDKAIHVEVDCPEVDIGTLALCALLVKAVTCLH